MQKYELMVIIENAISDEVKKNVTEKIKAFLTSNKANDLTVDVWGTKKYAYKINHKSEGYYVVFNFASNSEVPNKLAEQLNINENVVRFMFTNLEK